MESVATTVVFYQIKSYKYVAPHVNFPQVFFFFVLLQWGISLQQQEEEKILHPN